MTIITDKTETKKVTTGRRVRRRKYPINKFSTDCCALCQLSITNAHTKAEIIKMLHQLKAEARSRNWLFTGKTMGQKAVFVITTPEEGVLAQNLKDIGFIPNFQFERREGYPKTGLLTMWCFNL